MKFTSLIIDDMGTEIARTLDSRSSKQCNALNITDIINGINFNLDNPLFDYENNKYCIFIDSSYIDPKTRDYAFAFAEKFIKKYPHLKDRVCVLVGEDLLEQREKDFLNGNADAGTWVRRISQLPYVVYNRKIPTISLKIKELAKQQGMDIEDTYSKVVLTSELQSAVNDLYTDIKRLYDINVWHADADKVKEQAKIHPELSETIIKAIEQSSKLRETTGHSFAQILFVLRDTYNARSTTSPEYNFDAKRLTDIQSILKNMHEFTTVSTKCIHGSLENLQSLLEKPTKSEPRLKQFLESFIENSIFSSHNGFMQIHDTLKSTTLNNPIDTTTNSIPEQGDA